MLPENDCIITTKRKADAKTRAPSDWESSPTYMWPESGDSTYARRR